MSDDDKSPPLIQTMTLDALLTEFENRVAAACDDSAMTEEVESAAHEGTLVRSIRPRIYGQVGATVNVYVGSSNEPYESPVYGDAIPFTIGTTVSCDTLVSGRYIAVKFGNGSAYYWRLDSYSIDIQPGGKW